MDEHTVRCQKVDRVGFPCDRQFADEDDRLFPLPFLVDLEEHLFHLFLRRDERSVVGVIFRRVGNQIAQEERVPEESRVGDAEGKEEEGRKKETSGQTHLTMRWVGLIRNPWKSTPFMAELLVLTCSKAERNLLDFLSALRMSSNPTT